MGKQWKQWQTLFSWAPKSLQTVIAVMKLLAPWKKNYDKPREHIKKQRHHFAHKGPSSQSYGFSSSHIQMWELDHEEGWTLKNWCFQTVVLEKTLESPLKSTLNTHWKDWWWSWNSNTLATWLQRADSLEKTLMLGKTEGKRRRGQQRMRWLNSITDSMDMNLGKLPEIRRHRETWCAAVPEGSPLPFFLTSHFASDYC